MEEDQNHMEIVVKRYEPVTFCHPVSVFRQWTCVSNELMKLSLRFGLIEAQKHDLGQKNSWFGLKKGFCHGLKTLTVYMKTVSHVKVPSPHIKCVIPQ